MTRSKILFPIMLDSGAYSAWRAGKEVNLNDYMGYVRLLTEKFPEAHFEYVNLDVIGDGRASYWNWRKMRDAGLNPMPVWHLTTGHKWLEEYLKLTDRVALSWFGAMPFKRRILSLDVVWEKYLTDSQGMPTAYIHGMGVADFRILLRYPWYTIDSTSWLLTAAMGDVFVPDMVNGEWAYDRKPIRVTVSGPTLRWGHGNKTGMKLSAHDEALVKSYFKHIKEPLEGEEGLRKHWAPRRQANMKFYWEFIRRLTFPRAFVGKAPRQLWHEDLSGVPDRNAVSAKLFEHTVLFLAGNIDWVDRKHFIKTCLQYPGIGRLTSFWYCMTPNSKAIGLENLLEALDENEIKMKKKG